MARTPTLTRRLTTSGCKIAGTQLEAVISGEKEAGSALHKEVVAEAKKVAHETEAIRSLTALGSMLKVDRGTDQAVAALDDTLEGKEGAYTGEDILPLTPDERAENELAARLRKALLPSGTGFLKLPYRDQWARLEVLDRALTARAAEIEKLELTTQARRLHRWIELYGNTLGITKQTAQTDTEAVAVDAWHTAWASYAEVVRYHTRDAKVAGATELRERLLAPYADQADAERAADREQKKATKASKGEEVTLGSALSAGTSVSHVTFSCSFTHLASETSPPSAETSPPVPLSPAKRRGGEGVPGPCS